ncbi:hypothetical protein AFE_2208 [Acidithiobacillus ferrooxidans ATCC 23270]|uniref:Uncharacterized protein n=1 Tax=Acidithiobacillus ferrooxidans (strain ATCC 23270 / DSM 14882 / CIP 104768 / NCIMB 8455) TaxID=243159 RepID=B7J5J7_ACIF2|nr:hypothetical protein AFE_2208 [Acidithiobacillus ferrooxidans ATCC 23270]
MICDMISPCCGQEAEKSGTPEIAKQMFTARYGTLLSGGQ